MGEAFLDRTTITVVGLATILAFMVWAWYITRREKKPFGEIISVMLVHHRESLFIGVVLVIYLAEAMLAASVHPANQTLPNPLARFISHFAISITGMAASVSFVRECAAVFEPKIDAGSIAARSVVAIISLILAWTIPVLNATLIAAGLGEDLKFSLFMADYFFFWISQEEFQRMVTYYGGALDYRSWAGMSYVLKTTIGLTGVHMFITIQEGFQNLSDKVRRQWLFTNPYMTEEDRKAAIKKAEDDKKREERKENKDGASATSGENRKLNEAEENIKYILKRFNYDGDDLTRVFKEATKALWETIQNRSQVDALTVSTKISELVNKFKELDKRTDITDGERERQNNELLHRTRTLFEKSPKPDSKKVEDVGLGIQLKGNKGKK